MKKLLLGLLSLPLLATAQNFHFSARAGFAGYRGDLKTTLVSQLKPMGSFGGQFDLSERITARTYFTYTNLQGDDKKGTAAMQQRNLNFSTRLIDWELTAQYSILSLNERWWTPYVFTGIGVARIDPFTTDAAGSIFYLQPLGTEGQGSEPGVKGYKRTQFTMPIGLGANYSLGEDSRVGIEIGYRKMFTDYLDDVSGVYVDEADLLKSKGPQAVALAWRGDEVSGTPYPAAGTMRGDGKKSDGYYYVTVTFTLRYWFDKYKQIAGIPGGGGGGGKRVGCPASRAPGF